MVLFGLCLLCFRSAHFRSGVYRMSRTESVCAGEVADMVQRGVCLLYYSLWDPIGSITVFVVKKMQKNIRAFCAVFSGKMTDTMTSGAIGVPHLTDPARCYFSFSVSNMQQKNGDT